MKTQDAERMYSLYIQRPNNTYIARLWDGHTRIAQHTDAVSCRNEALSVIRAAQGCEFVGTLQTQVKTLNNDTSGNPRVAYIAYLHLTDVSVSPLADCPLDKQFTQQSLKADRGYVGTDQPVEDAAMWARREFKRHCHGAFAGSEVVYVANPLRHHPADLTSLATPPHPTSGRYVEQSYLVYAVPAGTMSALQKLGSHVHVSVVPRLTEHYYHTFRRAVAYRKSVCALESALLEDPVQTGNDLVTIKVRDTYRPNVVVTIATTEN